LLLILLGVVVAAFLFMQLGGSSGGGGGASNARRAPRVAAAGAEAPIEPAQLDVRLEALEAERPGFGETERNPFRFQPKPPPQAAPPRSGAPGSIEEKGPPPGPAGPPPPPPITVKFIGTMVLPDGVTVAIFTDCTVGRINSTPVREGQTILGQYRLVKIGLTSVVVEHLDGRGRTTLPKTGQECVK
jgi:hypothetical protein